MPLTKTVAVPPSSTSIPSGLATGGLSFTGAIVIVTVALAVRPSASRISYSNPSAKFSLPLCW